MIVFRGELEKLSFVSSIWIKWWIGPEKLSVDVSQDGDIWETE